MLQSVSTQMSGRLAGGFREAELYNHSSCMVLELMKLPTPHPAG